MKCNFIAVNMVGYHSSIQKKTCSHKLYNWNVNAIMLLYACYLKRTNKQQQQQHHWKEVEKKNLHRSEVYWENELGFYASFCSFSCFLSESFFQCHSVDRWHEKCAILHVVESSKYEREWKKKMTKNIWMEHEQSVCNMNRVKWLRFSACMQTFSFILPKKLTQ